MDIEYINLARAAYAHLDSISLAVSGCNAEIDETPLGVITCALFEGMRVYLEKVYGISSCACGKENEDAYYEITDRLVRFVVRTKQAWNAQSLDEAIHTRFPEFLEFSLC